MPGTPLQRPVIGVTFHRLAYPMKHEPCRLLRDPNRSRNFVRRNSVLAVCEHPDNHHPLVKSDSRILKDRFNLEAELLFAAIAFPYPACLDESVPLRTTTRTSYCTVRPPIIQRVLKSAVTVREVDDRVLKSTRAFHEPNVRSFIACVKYVISHRSPAPYPLFRGL